MEWLAFLILLLKKLFQMHTLYHILEKMWRNELRQLFELNWNELQKKLTTYQKPSAIVAQVTKTEKPKKMAYENPINNPKVSIRFKSLSNFLTSFSSPAIERIVFIQEAISFAAAADLS